jgi:hypothetical protein
LKNTGTRYDPIGMVIINVLLLIACGLIIMCFNGFNYTWDNFTAIISQTGIFIMFSLFFIGVGLFCDIMFIKEKASPKKKIVAKLISIERTSQSQYMDINFDHIYILTFRDSKNKDYFFQTNDINSLEEENNYNISVKNKTVISANGTTNEKVEIKENDIKESYWLTFYLSEDVKFEKFLLLPIAYFGFLLGVVIVISSNGFEKITSLPLLGVCGYMIINDFYLKKTNK